MKRLIIIDISSFIFRAFYAIRLLSAPDGTPVNSVYGVLNMLLKLISKYKPSHLFIARDTASETFRSEIYPEYKANRTEPPEELIPQFDLIEKLISHMGMSHLSKDGYEADDLIGSAVTTWRDLFDEIMIASGDKDLMQLVGGNVVMVDTMKDIIYDRDKVKEKMGVWPDQVIDYLSMVGDSSDNIPGMRGIGAKGAATLLQEHGSLENCIARKDSFKGKKLTTAFSDYLDDAILSKELITIATDIDLGILPDKLNYKFTPSDSLLDFLTSLDFKSTVVKLREMERIETDVSKDADSAFVNLDEEEHSTSNNCTPIVSEADYKTLLEHIDGVSAAAVEIFYTSNIPHSMEVGSLAISVGGRDNFYISFVDSKFSKKHLHEILTRTYGRDSIEVYSSNSKRDIEYLIQYGIDYKAQSFDISQVHFVLDADSRHDLVSMVKEYLGVDVTNKDDSSVPVDVAGARAAAVYSISNILRKELKDKEVESVYYEIDDPMTVVLATMEMNGVMINCEYFEDFEIELANKLSAIEKKIAKYSDDENINLNSPKQVGALLFDTLGLPVIKKTKTGNSTDVEVLEVLASRNISPVPKLLLQYRELGKLLSTYVRPLPSMINSTSGRIHTSFNQNIAATGRLSSTNPNLQNIPIRTELGRRVRKGFIPEPGMLFMGADYSQVELRLLAHFSGDPVMVESFLNGVDIHKQTAAEVLGASIEDVSIEERAVAKAVNFGLMYGQSSFGLAAQLHISRREAKEYITRYFTRFFSVKDYLDSLKSLCEEHGYSITLMGRKRFLPNIRSKNRTIKSSAERVAINSPIQGTAADIIKIAMIEIDLEMKERGLESKMVLQVHDELIFEVPELELEEMKSLVKEKMENVVSLDVPLTVDIGVGVQWFDLK